MKTKRQNGSTLIGKQQDKFKKNTKRPVVKQINLWALLYFVMRPSSNEKTLRRIGSFLCEIRLEQSFSFAIGTDPKLPLLPILAVHWYSNNKECSLQANPAGSTFAYSIISLTRVRKSGRTSASNHGFFFIQI